MKIRYNGYYWTITDIISAIGIVVTLFYFAVVMLEDVEISIASIFGAIWGFGTLAFMFLYQFPIFGNSIEAQELLDKQKEIYTQEEAQIILETRKNKNISPSTLKWFMLFFVGSGSMALVGIFSNT